MTAVKKKNEILMFRELPLMRKDNIIYYGRSTDKFIIMMQILETNQVGSIDIATKVSVQLQRTDRNIKSKDRVVRKSEKDGLYSAIDVAYVWLTRALERGA